MKKERGCARNHWMRGGGTATFTSPAGIVQPGFYPEIKVVDSCSVARPGMIQMTPKGLMGGSRRRRDSRRRASHKRRRTHRKMRGGDCGCSAGLPKLMGGNYKMDLAGQGMQPNQFAEVVKVSSCGAQNGGAPFIEMPSVGYGNKGELVTAEGGNVVPVMTQQPYNNTLSLSSACTKTGGGRRRSVHRRRRGKKASRRHARK